MRIAALALIALHAAILAGHDAAHSGLGVGLLPWQQAYAYSLIVAAPLIAGLLLLLGRLRAGFGLLMASMLAAFAFGVFHHYVAISPDHVNHLPHGPEQGLFRSTAALMALIEIAAAGVGWWGYRAAGPLPEPDSGAGAGAGR